MRARERARATTPRRPLARSFVGLMPSTLHSCSTSQQRQPQPDLQQPDNSLSPHAPPRITGSFQRDARLCTNEASVDASRRSTPGAAQFRRSCRHDAARQRSKRSVTISTSTAAERHMQQPTSSIPAAASLPLTRPPRFRTPATLFRPDSEDHLSQEVCGQAQRGEWRQSWLINAVQLPLASLLCEISSLPASHECSTTVAPPFSRQGVVEPRTTANVQVIMQVRACVRACV
jgi:hypothetical protein